MDNVIQARKKDFQNVLELLKLVNLPIDGVNKHFKNYFIVIEGKKLVGCAGLEIHDEVGLLRSVAVHPSFQGHGLGHKLVDRIHKYAIEKGLKEIYLLTETAESFFSKLDYFSISREKTNPSVKQSIEFTSTCPASAVCMVKKL